MEKVFPLVAKIQVNSPDLNKESLRFISRMEEIDIQYQEWKDVNVPKITFICGPRSSGKSTVAARFQPDLILTEDAQDAKLFGKSPEFIHNDHNHWNEFFTKLIVRSKCANEKKLQLPLTRIVMNFNPNWFPNISFFHCLRNCENANIHLVVIFCLDPPRDEDSDQRKRNRRYLQTLFSTKYAHTVFCTCGLDEFWQRELGKMADLSEELEPNFPLIYGYVTHKKRDEEQRVLMLEKGKIMYTK